MHYTGKKESKKERGGGGPNPDPPNTLELKGTPLSKASYPGQFAQSELHIRNRRGRLGTFYRLGHLGKP